MTATRKRLRQIDKQIKALQDEKDSILEKVNNTPRATSHKQFEKKCDSLIAVRRDEDLIEKLVKLLSEKQTDDVKSLLYRGRCHNLAFEYDFVLTAAKDDLHVTTLTYGYMDLVLVATIGYNGLMVLVNKTNGEVMLNSDSDHVVPVGFTNLSELLSSHKVGELWSMFRWSDARGILGLVFLMAYRSHPAETRKLAFENKVTSLIHLRS